MVKRVRARRSAMVLVGLAALATAAALAWWAHRSLDDPHVAMSRALTISAEVPWILLALGVLLGGLVVALMHSRWKVRDNAGNLRASERRLETMVTELRSTAYTDALTGLPNRASLTRELSEAADRTRPAGEVLATILLDLDDFKEINDTLGHEAGDQALVGVSRRLQAALREEDFVARLGGDEFVVVCTIADRAGELAVLADRILTMVTDQPLWVAGRHVAVSASAGVAVAGRWYVSPGELLRQADTALYAAKGGGKRSWTLFDVAMQEAVQERFSLSQELGRAIDTGQLSLAYQPIVELRSGTMVEVEALLRWDHPSRRDIPVAHLIEVAESTGLAPRLTGWVLDQACTQAAQWHLRGAPESFVVAVNMSAPQLTDPGTVELVRQTLASTGCAARWLAIELTETSLSHDPDAALDVLRRLGALGVHLSLDDFGTGYSSLSHLLRLPVEMVKVDRSVLVETDDVQRSTRFLAGVCSVASNLGLRVLIEGVETPEQLAIVRLSGFHLVQGFLTGRPQSAQSISTILADGAAPRLAARPRHEGARALR